MTSTDLSHPAIDAVLSTAATLLGMEVVFLGGLTDESFTVQRMRGSWSGEEPISEGLTVERTDSFCHRMLSGGPSSTADAALEPAYIDAPSRDRLGICSYVGVPVRDPSGRVVATLCGIDRGSVAVDEATLGVLRELAEIVTAHLVELPQADVVVRRTPAGWEVDGERTPDLTSAMVLADLLASEVSPGSRPPRPRGELDEVGQLKLSVTQLEHALAARVTVEQAIGVLAERQRSSPRDAFERLRRVARSRGRRVHDLAREVVASAADHSIPLPPELAGRR